MPLRAGAIIAWLCVLSGGFVAAEGRIDREAVVSRHRIRVNESDPLVLLSVGNGNFAFGVDATGLQSFNGSGKSWYMTTQSSWGWHTDPYPPGVDPFRDFQFDIYNTTDVFGRARTVPYGTCKSGNICPECCGWLYVNPHRLNLGQIGFRLGGEPLSPENVSQVSQELDPWEGVIYSNFSLSGAPVAVTTVAAFDTSTIAVEVKVPSALAGPDGLSMQVAFPFASAAASASDWNQPGKHTTVVTRNVTLGGRRVLGLVRTLDDDEYFVVCESEASDRSASWELRRNGPHSFSLSATGTGTDQDMTVWLSCRFDPPNATSPPPLSALSYSDVCVNSRRGWGDYWNNGAMLDLSGSFDTDPRAFELERRVILSQYIMRVHTAGDAPPQETGLYFNSWGGKHHQEMRWWHHAHFAVWNRSELLRASDDWYVSRLQNASSHAKSQGYEGARWPKCVGPSNHKLNSTGEPSWLLYWESYNGINPLLFWHQPHPIHMAELVYRAQPTKTAQRETVERLGPVVAATASFIASYLSLNLTTQRYHMGPPVIDASESHSAGYPTETLDPVFSLAYANYTLYVANEWRLRAGLPRNETWADMRARLAPLPTFRFPDNSSGVEFFPWHAASSNQYSRCGVPGSRGPFDSCGGPTGHPSQAGAMSIVPGIRFGVDAVAMENTLRSINASWNWVWGWDFGMTAMASMRLGLNDLAMDLLMKNDTMNDFLPNGANFGRGMMYLPGNGALLVAVGMAAGGWEANGGQPLAGFPSAWDVKAEGFVPFV